jgi:hypothetical protein
VSTSLLLDLILISQTVMAANLDLFDGVANSRHYIHTEIVIFFTNISLFRKKIASGDRPIKRWFPAYEGSDLDADSGMDFFTDLILRRNRVASRVCTVEYIHEHDSKILLKLHRCMDIAFKQRKCRIEDD